MATIRLVTGGARSGKSAFVEEQLKNASDVCYIATGIQKQDDKEWQERIRLHQERRPKTWITHESYQKLDQWFCQTHFPIYLLDSATMLTSNRLFELIAKYYPDHIDGTKNTFLSKDAQTALIDLLTKEWLSILNVVKHQSIDLWIVTDEVGLGIVPDTALGRFFRDLQGSINQLLAKEASQVYMVVCGLAQQLK